VTEQKRSGAVYKTSSFTLQEKLGLYVLLRFRQEDFSENLVETSLSPWVLESDFCALQYLTSLTICNKPHFVFD